MPITTRTQAVAMNLRRALAEAGASPNSLGGRITPEGFADRVAEGQSLLVSDVCEAAALVGVSAASLLGD